MSASLVGSEMCIRDRLHLTPWQNSGRAATPSWTRLQSTPRQQAELSSGCLLYTSDAADDM
eukprot:10997708-Alexandrium_andersonii.AAC.1